MSLLSILGDNSCASLALSSLELPQLGLLVSGAVVVTAIIAGAASRAARASQRERSRRELAAYVAEGSMTADEAERILASGGTEKSGCCGAKQS